MVPGLVSSLLTAWHPADLAQCAAQFGMLSAVLLGFAAGFVWLWPYRLRHQCYLTPAGLVINGVTAALSSAALYRQGLLGAVQVSVLLTATVAIQTAGLVMTVMSLVAEAMVCASGVERVLAWSVSGGRVLPSTEVKAAFDSDSLPSSIATADALEIVLDVGPEASCGSSDEVSIGSDSVEMVSNDGGEALDALPPSFVPRRADADDAFVTRRFTPDQCVGDGNACQCADDDDEVSAAYLHCCRGLSSSLPGAKQRELLPVCRAWRTLL